MNTSLDLVHLIVAFANDPRTLSIVTLVFLDLVLGVAAALKTGTFRLDLVGQWYIKNVLPFLVSFFALYVVSQIGVADLAGAALADLTTYVSAAPAVAELLASVRRHLATLIQGVPPVPAE